MMPTGTCDPATRVPPQPYNVLQLAVGNNDVFVIIRYGWDNTSVRPNCDGPLVNGTGGGNTWAISYTNAGQTTYYMKTVGRNGTPRTLTINPGASGTLTKAQAASAGYNNVSDCDSLQLTTTP